MAFCKRSAIARQLTNYLTEPLFIPATKRAEFLDRYLAEHGKPVGPLHRLPISMKDTFKIAGVDPLSLWRRCALSQQNQFTAREPAA